MAALGHKWEAQGEGLLAQQSSSMGGKGGRALWEDSGLNLPLGSWPSRRSWWHLQDPGDQYSMSETRRLAWCQCWAYFERILQQESLNVSILKKPLNICTSQDSGYFEGPLK